MSKLGWFVRLKISRLYLSLTRSVICVIFTTERSARFCHGWRKMLRSPPFGMKLVSKVSPGGIAEQGNDPSTCAALGSLQGRSSGTSKQDAFSAGKLKLLPIAPVNAFCGVQPGASGTIVFVIASERS